MHIDQGLPRQAGCGMYSGGPGGSSRGDGRSNGGRRRPHSQRPLLNVEPVEAAAKMEADRLRVLPPHGLVQPERHLGALNRNSLPWLRFQEGLALAGGSLAYACQKRQAGSPDRSKGRSEIRRFKGGVTVTNYVCFVRSSPRPPVVDGFESCDACTSEGDGCPTQDPLMLFFE